MRFLSTSYAAKLVHIRLGPVPTLIRSQSQGNQPATLLKPINLFFLFGVSLVLCLFSSDKRPQLKFAVEAVEIISTAFQP